MKFRHYARPSRLCWVGLTAALVGLNGCGMPGSGLLIQDGSRPEATAEVSGSMDDQWRQMHELLDQAKANVEQFELDTAISQCTKLLEHTWPLGTRNVVQDSFQAEVYLWRGKAFLAKGFPFIAVDDFDDAVDLSDRALKPEAYVQRARAANVLKRWSRAVEDCSRAIRIQPNHGEAFLVRSQALAEVGQQELARNSLLEAERLGVRTSFKVLEPVPVLQQARELLEQGKPDLARELLGRALLTGYNSPETNGLLARAQLELAEYYRAMAACNRALRLDPSYAEAYRIRGVAQYHREDFDQAIVDLNSAIYLDPSLSDGVAPFLTAAREKGGMDPAVRSQALANIQRDYEADLTRQTPTGPREQWLLDLMAMPNTTEQISHFKQLVSSSGRTEPDYLNWLADFLMVDRGLPAAKFLKSYLLREPTESESISAVELALCESIESASTGAVENVNLFADTIAYAIHYQFNSLLEDCIDTGVCRPKLNHLYQAIEQPEAGSLNTLLPQAVLLDREVEALLDQAMELDRKSHVQLLIQKYRESLTGTVLEYLERPERNR